MNKAQRFRITYFLLCGFLLFFIGLMIRIILPYLSLSNDVGFLRIKQPYVNNKFWLTAFFIHAFTAVLALPAGLTQFSAFLRRKWRKIHRISGQIYVFIVLLFAAPSGLILGFYANGKLPSRIGFVILACLWFLYTLQAFRMALLKRFDLHQNFMIRSYALTLSAITLRLWKYGLANTIAPDPLDLYQMVTWLGFVPNILVAEYIIYRIKKR